MGRCLKDQTVWKKYARKLYTALSQIVFFMIKKAILPTRQRGDSIFINEYCSEFEALKHKGLTLVLRTFAEPIYTKKISESTSLPCSTLFDDKSLATFKY
jgi:hypothetical protein